MPTKKLVITISIDPRPGVFIPRPNELAKHLKHALMCRMGDVQRLRSAREMRELYATIAEMVHFESHVEVQHD